ncbi:MAG: hypothetical protein ABSH04_02820 [Acidimicrobiales bacterium]|jgi:K+-transporting ATPase c subunit
MGVEELAERLSAIAEELGDLAFERLREASGSGHDDGVLVAALVAQEKRITRARRAVEKAATLLRAAEMTDG